MNTFAVRIDAKAGISWVSSLWVGRAEGTTFQTFQEAVTVKCIDQGHNVMAGIWTHTLQLTTRELGSSELDRSASTLHYVVF